MKIKEKTCNTALSISKLPGLDYALNPYQGCMHQCAYCYVPTVCHTPIDQWNTTVYVKRNIPLILSKELITKKMGTVGISTVTDAYQPIEKTYQLTRYCLEQLLKKDFPISIQTKSTLVKRDKDLIQQFSKSELMVSIATSIDSHRRILEPDSSSIADRLSILKEFKDSTVNTSVFLGPLYPITQNELKKMLDIFLDLNVSKIMIDRFHLKPGTLKQINIYSADQPDFLKNINEYLSHQQKRYEKSNHFINNYLKNTSINVVDAF